MGIHFGDVLHFSIRQGSQTVHHFYLIHCGDKETVLSHQVYSLCNRSGGAVVNWQNAVFQFAGFYCFKDLLKGRIELNVPFRKECLCGGFGVCTHGALTADTDGFLHAGRFEIGGIFGSDQHFLL